MVGGVEGVRDGALVGFVGMGVGTCGVGGCWCLLCDCPMLLSGGNQGEHWYGTAGAKDLWCYCQV
jgi:hypothetical protein